MKVTENVTADESIDEQLALSSEDVEAYLDRCFLQALHTTVKDKDLPMPGSTFWLVASMSLHASWFLMLLYMNFSSVFMSIG